MKSLLKTCGLAAFVLSGICFSLTDAEAGGRRRGCYSQSYYAPAATYAAPATAYTTDGHQRYQSAYQAPAYSNSGNYYQAPANNYLYGSGHYGGGIPLNFQDRNFRDQWDAGRKIRGY